MYIFCISLFCRQTILLRRWAWNDYAMIPVDVWYTSKVSYLPIFLRFLSTNGDKLIKYMYINTAKFLFELLQSSFVCSILTVPPKLAVRASHCRSTSMWYSWWGSDGVPLITFGVYSWRLAPWWPTLHSPGKFPDLVI